MRKKLSSIILTLVIAIGMLPTADNAQAELGIKHEFEISLMAALGIVPGYPDSYKAETEVLQTEFAEYVYSAVGSKIIDAQSLVASFGWTGGDTKITVGQAAELTLRTIGYESFVKAQGGDYYSYAGSIGLLSGISNGGRDSVLNLEGAALMLYNAIMLDTVEYSNREYSFGSESIMEDKLNVYKSTGIVTANGITGLDGYGSVSDSCVRIGDTVYNIGKTSSDLMLGMYVKFYYKDDFESGEYVIKWIEADESKNSRAVIYGCDVTEVKGNTVKYNSNTGSEKTARIDENADIIYNGKLDNAVTLDAMKSLTCETILIDNGEADNYNVVIINDYTYYLVEGFSSSTLVVNDYCAKSVLDVDKDNYKSFSVYKNGVPADISDIAVGQVLAVTLSEDKTAVRLEIINGSVSGEVTSYSSDSVVIGGTEYDISPAYTGDQLKNGRSGVFYFDKLGKIVRCQTERGQNSKYGYIMKFFSDGDGESDFTARILTAEGAVADFKVRDTLTFNDTKKSSKDAYYLLDAGNNCEQLITYSIDENNVITKLNMADDKYIGVDEEEIDEFTMNYKGAGRYRKNNMTFNSKYLIDSTTPIFLVPYSGDKEDYCVKNSTYLTNNWTYDISVYDIDSYMYASAVVLRENLIEPENLRTKRSMIITKILKSIDSEGEEGILLEGYYQGSKASYFLADENMLDNRGKMLVSSMSAGDVIQFGVNTDNEINAVQLLFRAQANKLSIADGTTTPGSYWEGGSSVFPDLWVSKGIVTDRNSELILVDDDGDEAKVSKHPHKLGNATVYLFENGKVAVSNKNEIAIEDNVYVHEYQGNVQEIIIVR